MTAKQRIFEALSTWIEAHHVPGGYGGKAQLPDPTSHEGGPWGYLKACLVDGEVYFRFLQSDTFAATWPRGIADIAQGRVFAMLPPASVLAGATSDTVPSDERARAAIGAGAVIAMRTDESGEPEYLILSPPTAEAAVYTFGAGGHRHVAESVAAFVEATVAELRARMPEQVRYSNVARGEAKGWSFGAPPGISAAEWPRHRRGGFPLAHGFTIELPDAYRVKKAPSGAPFVAVSFFHPGDAEAVGFDDPEGVEEAFAGGEVPEDPFLAAVHAHGRALEAPNEERYVHVFSDAIEQTHAIVFHTAASFAAARAELPSETGPHDLADIFPTLAEAAAPLYVAATDERRVLSLGRPVHPMQGDEAVRNMGYYVIELSCDAGGANFADGTAQYDLESGAFDWSC